MSNLYVKDILLTETYKNYNFAIKDVEEKTIDAKTFLNIYKSL